MVMADHENPLNLGLEYIWKAGDTPAWVALMYRQHEDKYEELYKLNRGLWDRNRFGFNVGDVIKIPEHWFPLPPLLVGGRDTTTTDRFKGA